MPASVTCKRHMQVLKTGYILQRKVFIKEQLNWGFKEEV